MTETEEQPKKTIAEMMESFKKHLWSNEKPMEFATDVVEELLLEIQRQQTVMRAGCDEIRRHWKTHVESDELATSQLQNLIASLAGKRNGFYSQYLSPSEYHEFVLRQSSFEAFAKAEAMTQGVDENVEEK